MIWGTPYMQGATTGALVASMAFVYGLMPAIAIIATALLWFYVGRGPKDA